MRTIAVIGLVSALLAVTPASAKITDVDHPDIPNCVMFPKSGHNAPNCETLTIQAVHPNNGLGKKSCHTWKGPDGILGTPDDVKSCQNSW